MVQNKQLATTNSTQNLNTPDISTNTPQPSKTPATRSSAPRRKETAPDRTNLKREAVTRKSKHLHCLRRRLDTSTPARISAMTKIAALKQLLCSPRKHSPFRVAYRKQPKPRPPRHQHEYAAESKNSGNDKAQRPDKGDRPRQHESDAEKAETRKRKAPEPPRHFYSGEDLRRGQNRRPRTAPLFRRRSTLSFSCRVEKRHARNDD